MKTLTTLILGILFSTLCNAQNGINYKAIIKDANGNVVANTLVVVQFTIVQGTAQTNVYRENHTPTTDANGIVILNIGEGTPLSGTFNTIDWAADTTFLNTKINTGAGLVDMGTTDFKTVPYALHAKTVSNNTFVSGNSVIHPTNLTDNFVIGSTMLDFDGTVDPIDYHDTSRMFFNKTKGAFRAGIVGVWLPENGMIVGNSQAWNDENVGFGSFASGIDNTASGWVSTAIGNYTNASGPNSTSMGSYTLASGESSTTMGNNTTASGDFSTATGSLTSSQGKYATTMGYGTIALSNTSLAIGRFNVGTGNPLSWIASDPLFEIGNGTGSANRSNALTILKNGKVGIGTNTPTTFLQLTNGYEATLSSTNSGYFMIGRETGPNLLFDTNEILARNNGANTNLHLQQEGGNVYVGGTITHSSDRRLKKDITPLSYGLETILQLNPVAYNWINRTQDRKSLGLIAQEVQIIIDEIVHQDDDEAKTLSVSYTELIPVLIKAIQEQQETINQLDSKVNALTSELNQLKTLK